MTISDGKTRITIDVATIKRYVAEGLTQEQMVERFYEDTGERRSVSAFGVAMSRAGIKSSRPRDRYKDELPWRVRREHSNTHPAQMLRTLGARNSGKDVPADRLYRLEVWLGKLDEDGLVVHYDPATKQGFWFVPRETVDGDGYIHLRGTEGYEN